MFGAFLDFQGASGAAEVPAALASVEVNFSRPSYVVSRVHASAPIGQCLCACVVRGHPAAHW
jgi:hypothetical protein